MNKTLANNKYLTNTYFSQSFKTYPALANKRRNLNILLCFGVFMPFVYLLALRSQYDSVYGTNFQTIVARVFYIMMLGSIIIMPIIFSIENKINKMMLCSTHHLVYSKCELKKLIAMIENDTKEELPININHPLYHELKKLLSLIEQYSFIYVSKINTTKLKEMDFSLSMIEIEQQIKDEINDIVSSPKKMNQLDELEIKIKNTNIKCLDLLNRHKLNTLHKKCFAQIEIKENMNPGLLKTFFNTIRAYY